MIIEDKGIFLTSRKFQESAYIVDCLLENHGLIRGYTRFKPKYGTLTPGNIVNVLWKARLDTHLGHITLENEKCISTSVTYEPLKNLALGASVTLTSMVLHEKEAHPEIYQRLLKFLASLDSEDESFLKLYAWFEVELLSKCGFGLELSKCAVTNSAVELAYISPKTGKAVSKSVGLPYHHKLFTLPQFLIDETSGCNYTDIHNTLRITGHFFQQHVWDQSFSNEPISRKQLKKLLLR